MAVVAPARPWLARGFVRHEFSIRSAVHGPSSARRTWAGGKCDPPGNARRRNRENRSDDVMTKGCSSVAPVAEKAGDHETRKSDPAVPSH